MRIFLTGANGYIGGAVATALIAAGHRVRGLVRDKAKADAVAAYGIDAVIGSLDDGALLRDEARAADAVVNAASSDHRGAVDALLGGLANSAKAFIHSSARASSPTSLWASPRTKSFTKATRLRLSPIKRRASPSIAWWSTRAASARWCCATP